MTETLQDKLQAQLQALIAECDAIETQSAPLRAEADRMFNEMRVRRDSIMREIIRIEERLPQVRADLAMLARALGGKRLGGGTR